MKTAAFSVLFVLGLVVHGTAAIAADAPRKARVAGGAEVALAASGQSAVQWTVKRSRVRDLRPRVRGTFD